MNKSTSKKREKQSKILIPTTLLLGLLLIYNVVSLMGDLKPHSHKYTNEYSSMEYTLRGRDYPELMQMVASNRSRDAETIVDTTEYVALANYYMTMMYYRMFKDADGEKAIICEKKAKEYRIQLKSDRFIKEADLIDQRYKCGN